MISIRYFRFLLAGFPASLAAASVELPLVSPTLRNGSFESGSGTTTITGWTTGFGAGETQRQANNASLGSWSLVIGQGSNEPNLGASVNTGHIVAEGDTFDLSFDWIPKLSWDADDQIRWRLFTTSDDTLSGTTYEIAAGNVSGFASGAAYQTETLGAIGGTAPIHAGHTLWLQFNRANTALGEFSRIDRVNLSVTTDTAANPVPLDASRMRAIYPMEGSARDFNETPAPADGSWTAGEAYAAGTIDSQCANFSGGGASVTLPVLLGRNFTASFWMRTTSTGGSGAHWWNGSGILGGSTTTNDLGVSLNGGKIAFGVAGPDTTIFSTTSVNDGQWHHVAAQRHHASGKLLLHIDGQLEAETTGPAGDRARDPSLTLGAFPGGEGFVTAHIDDLRFFDALLDSSSVARLHTSAGDYDGDGSSDLAELVAGTSWTDGSSVIPAPSIATTPGLASCEVTIDAVSGRTYTLQRSGGLDGGWTNVGTAKAPTMQGPLTLDDPAPAGSRGFYRVSISGRGKTFAARPNIVLIYADDVGYGDVKAYNPAGLIPTPNIDQLAAEGLRFTDGHCTASTCSPSRFSMLTGAFAFRGGPGILAPTAALSIPESTYTLPDLLQDAGYQTAVVGKWHLGIGNGDDAIDWNGVIAPGPLEIGFGSCFMLPTTNDRVPCVYLRNHGIDGLLPGDPLRVHNNSYAAVNIAGSTQYPHDSVAAQTYYTSSSGHNNSVINGIGRIGYMSGGAAALWNDETMAQVFVQEAKTFIAAQDETTPFFLYFASQDIHVPRAPHPDFQGATSLGFRGDAMVQFDWSTGEILQALEDAGLDDNTIVILSSDNGPVFDDGYNDGSANDESQGHDASGMFRGGKYSILEGGTRVPFIVRWPARIQPGVSAALVNQVDLMGSFASMLGVELPPGAAPDSLDILPALLGDDPTGLPFTIEQDNTGNNKALRVGNMKYISAGALYNLATDPEETINLAASQPALAAAMSQQLTDIVESTGIREIE